MEKTKHTRPFHGKIMLFGEYSIISGSSAAIIPYRKVKAVLCSGFKAQDTKALRSNGQLKEFASYLARLASNEITGEILDLQRLREDLDEGLYLDSTIPENYGLGSSGAVCAALYATYNKYQAERPEEELRSVFSLMESYFHGTSSGIDPLSIYIGEPLIFRNNTYIKPGAEGPYETNKLKAFLIDTGYKSITAPHVAYFKAQLKKHDFQQSFLDEYCPLTDQAVEQWSRGKLQENAVFALSRIQQKIFKPMIPPTFQEIWMRGIYTGMYALKLCGSGGGGMLLGFTNNITDTKDYLNKNYCICIEPI
jgi:mevalonate kinase